MLTENILVKLSTNLLTSPTTIITWTSPQFAPDYQGPRSRFSTWGLKKIAWGRRRLRDVFFFWGGGRGSGGRGGHDFGFPFNFSKVRENAIMTIKLLIFSHLQ